MTKLEHLDLSSTRVKDLRPLAGLTALRYLALGQTPVRDVRPLRGLTKLRLLYLNRTRVTNIAPLASLVDLRQLIVSNRVTKLDALRPLKRLRSLEVSGPAIRDLSPWPGSLSSPL